MTRSNRIGESSSLMGGVDGIEACLIGGCNQTTVYIRRWRMSVWSSLVACGGGANQRPIWDGLAHMTDIQYFKVTGIIPANQVIVLGPCVVS